MTTPRLLNIDRQGEIVLLELNRADKRNALNDQLIDELGEFFIQPPEEARVIVLHGAGEHFCAGLDLFEMMAKPPRNAVEGQRRSRQWHRVFDLMQFGEVPIVSRLVVFRLACFL